MNGCLFSVTTLTHCYCGLSTWIVPNKITELKQSHSHTHTYLALFNDPLDSIWHHLWMKFQAATAQYSEASDVATSLAHRNMTSIKSKPKQYPSNGLHSLEVPEHISSTEQHGCGVGNISSHSLCKGVACTLKKRVLKQSKHRNVT